MAGELKGAGGSGGLNRFFDSYALIAMLSGSEEYKGFKIGEGATTLLNLMEVHYFLRREGAKEGEIKDTLSSLMPLCIGFSEGDCYEAVEFRHKNKAKRLSYIDCLGYMLARRGNLAFVTGDKEFKGMPGVEFVRWGGKA